VAPAGASAAIYWLRTRRNFFCAKTGVVMQAPTKDKADNNHRRRDKVLCSLINNHHPFGATTLLAIRKQNNDACH